MLRSEASTFALDVGTLILSKCLLLFTFSTVLISRSPLADVHPTDFSHTLFPGQDYNNARVLDFQQVDHFVSNQVSIQDTARMPWHDVHMTLTGPVVLDIVQHFVERWNEVKTRKVSEYLT